MSFLVETFRQRLEERECKIVMRECEHLQTSIVDKLVQSGSS
jgi:hypothetical protein